MSVYTLYVKKYCPSSQAAIKAAKSTKTKCVIIDLEEYNCSINEAVSKLKQTGFIKKSSKHQTVPIVFLDGNFIGGNTDLQRMLSN